MSAERKARSVARIAEPNVTPMIDVLLVLLIIFMVVTPTVQRSLDTALPKPPNRIDLGKEPDRRLVLEIAPAGYRINHQPVAGLDDLGERVRSLMEVRADKTLFVRADGEVGYSRVVEALDVVKAAGVDRIGMLALASNGQDPF